jgi:ABC-type bacteriocin/lantibiotic exporter with double-glycine peptidase domain
LVIHKAVTGVYQAILKAIAFTSRSDRKKLILITIITFLISLLDLSAVALAGVIGALAVRGIQAQNAGERVGNLMETLNLEQFDLKTQILILSIVALGLLILRSFLSYYFARKIFVYMSNSANKITKDVTLVQKRSVQENLYAITTGVNNLMLGLLGSVINIATDLVLFTILFAGMFIVDPWIAASAFIVFASLALLLYKGLEKRASTLGRNFGRLNVVGNEKITELLSSFREITVRQSAHFYVKKIVENRQELIYGMAQMRVMPLVSKYVLEVALLILVVFITYIQFTFNDTSRAIGNLAVFMAASSRITPAVLRVQQNLLSMKNAIGSSQSTLSLISDFERLGADKHPVTPSLNHDSNHIVPKVSLNSVFFKYPGKDTWVLEDISIEIPANSFVGIVGRSGAGKSTLVDLMLGLLSPDKGEILLSGMPPRQAVKQFPRQVAYVPQNVFMHKGTVLENVLAGISLDDVDKLWLDEIFNLTGLTEIIRQMPEGENTEVQDRGVSLSGGQKQRIGIARALVTKPALLILDEATSSLDAVSEDFIGRAITKLQVSTTVVVVAHRLSTIRLADSLVYLEDGKLVAQANFTKLRELVPDFDKQALLMGIN